MNQKGKAKAAGQEVITNFIIAEKTIFLLSIYDKAEKEDITDKELAELMKYVLK